MNAKANNQSKTPVITSPKDIVLHRTAPWNKELTSDNNFNVPRWTQIGERYFHVEANEGLYYVEETDASGQTLGVWIDGKGAELGTVYTSAARDYKITGFSAHAFGLAKVREVLFEEAARKADGAARIGKEIRSNVRKAMSVERSIRAAELSR